jgi:SAM-dependent methyltransferase
MSSTQTGPYTDDFHAATEREALQSARIIVPILVELIAPTSVIDFGCGSGAWLKAFQESGITRLLGLDSHDLNESRLLIDPTCFRRVDLARRVPCVEPFDLALCLEVAEHLPKGSAERLVAELARTAPVILFSAALPRQGGTHHVNEQWPWYWEREFARHSYLRLDPLRRLILWDRRVSWCYRQNLFLFVREDVLSSQPALENERRASQEFDFVLIQKDVFTRLTSLGGLLSQFPDSAMAFAVQRAVRLWRTLFLGIQRSTSFNHGRDRKISSTATAPQR